MSLTEKVEASELQLSSISNSYRAQLNLREVSEQGYTRKYTYNLELTKPSLSPMNINMPP